MPKISLLCFILAEILLIHATAADSDKPEISVVIAGTTDRHVSVAPKPAESGDEGPRSAEAPEIRRMGKHHSDMAGGGVIIGGLVTAVVAVVFCYIRVTRRNGGVEPVH